MFFKNKKYYDWIFYGFLSVNFYLRTIMCVRWIWGKGSSKLWKAISENRCCITTITKDIQAAFPPCLHVTNKRKCTKKNTFSLKKSQIFNLFLYNRWKTTFKKKKKRIRIYFEWKHTFLISFPTWNIFWSCFSANYNFGF